MKHKHIQIIRVIPVLGLLISAAVFGDDHASKEIDFSVKVKLLADGMIQGLMQEHNVPGLTLSIVKDGKVIVAKGYGYHDLNNKRPVDPERSLFRVGSVSKTMTWTAIMQLVEQGRLDLHEDVNTYLKNLKIPHTHGVPLTLNDMLAHRPGFEDGMRGYLFERSPEDVMSLEATLQKHMPAQVRKPGEAVSYSNYASALAGLIIQDVTGQPFQDYMDENIFKPLGMTHTTFREPLGEDHPEQNMAAHLQADIAPGYVTRSGRHVESGYDYIHSFGPAGSVSTTAFDMARYMIAHLQKGELNGHRLLKEKTALQMRKRNFTDRMAATGFAHGFFNGRFAGYEYFGHGGVVSTFITKMVFIPELQFGVFVSINQSPGRKPAANIWKNLVTLLFPRKTIFTDVKPPADFAGRGERFTGTYLANRRSFTTMEKLASLKDWSSFVLDEEGYLIRSDGTAWVEVAPLTFRNAKSEEILTFSEDGNGRILHYSIVAGHQSSEKIGFLQTPSFLYYAIGIAVFLSFTTLIGVGYRQTFERDIVPASWPAKMGAIAALGVLSFAVGFGTMIQQFISHAGQIMFTYPMSSVVAAKWLAIAASLLIIGLMWSVHPAWKNTEWKLVRKLHHSAFALAGINLVYALWQWNFFGPYN